MDIIIISLIALLASLMTFFTGFGLGTILTPVFAIFFPIDIAIALTGIVHLLNNIFKLVLVGKDADKTVVLKFGIPAIIAAFIGAELMIRLSDLQPLFSYYLFNTELFIYPIKIIVAILMITFAIMEIIPALKNIQFDSNKLYIGGALSGFFGGLSGHQGAFRSAFLLKAGLSKEAFIATGVTIACLVDFTRLSVYFSKFLTSGVSDNVTYIISATLSAFVGAYFGKKLLKKITLNLLQFMVSVLIIILAVLLGTGII
jgi:uncharacterized membrane protein YfcA